MPVWVLCIADMICGPVRASPGGGVDKIVAAGGYAVSTNYDITEIYDVATDSWSVGELGFMASESSLITPGLCTHTSIVRGQFAAHDRTRHSCGRT